MAKKTAPKGKAAMAAYKAKYGSGKTSGSRASKIEAGRAIRQKALRTTGSLKGLSKSKPTTSTATRTKSRKTTTQRKATILKAGRKAIPKDARKRIIKEDGRGANRKIVRNAGRQVVKAKRVSKKKG